MSTLSHFLKFFLHLRHCSFVQKAQQALVQTAHLTQDSFTLLLWFLATILGSWRFQKSTSIQKTKKKNGKEKSMHESRKPLIWYRASVQTGTQASPAVGIVSRQKPTIHHQIQAATREMLVLTFSPFRNWQIESTLNSLRRPHSLLQTGRKSQLAVCAHGKTSPYPAGQACSFMRARIAKGAQKHILEGISVPSMRATFIFLYWWDVTSGIFCKTSSEIITKDWIQACFCKEGQNKPSCTDNKCQRQWKHFSFRERRQKKTTTKKSTSHFYSGVGYRRVWKHKHAQVFPWLFCSGLQNPADRERTHKLC